MIKDKVVRICDSFMGQRFDLPEPDQIPAKIQEIERNIIESKALTKKSEIQLKNYLIQINQLPNVDSNKVNNGGENSTSILEVYKWFVAKEKAIYSSLNLLRQANGMYIGYFWSPSDSEDTIRMNLANYGSTDL